MFSIQTFYLCQKKSTNIKRNIRVRQLEQQCGFFFAPEEQKKKAEQSWWSPRETSFCISKQMNVWTSTAAVTTLYGAATKQKQHSSYYFIHFKIYVHPL